MTISRPYFSFQTKVLIPVITVMVMLVAITMWMVNRRITQQLQNEASQALITAEAVFKNSQKIRSKNLLLRYGNVHNDTRFKIVWQKGDPETTRVLLKELLGELDTDLAIFSADDGKPLASAIRDERLNLGEFESAAALSIIEAMEGQPNVDTIQVSQRLFDVVSIPVTIGNTNNIVGALTFGTEIGEMVAEEFSLITRSGIAFLVNDRVVASSLPKADLYQRLAALFGEVADNASKHRHPLTEPIHSISVAAERYLCKVGQFNSMKGDTRLGYVVLSSFEQPLRELQATQHRLFWVSLLGILVSSLIVWFFIRKITQPLRQLRDSAEAVGQGDFSRHVPASSRDECGELAAVFNRMTENLKHSHEELEKTVQTLKTTQAHLIQNEKLSAIGEFVAGVTHELNNPLTSLIGFTELLQKSEVNERQRRFLDRIVQSTQRCHKIVQSLLSFARQHQPERKLANLNELIEAAVDILAYEMRTSNINVVTQLEASLPQVMVDAHQVQQVFLNVINNARQAIEANQPKGSMHIRSEAFNGHVCVILQDDGPGISEENLRKIFNPFFTTKEAGKGTGLGLSLSYGIIKEHGGTITAQSKPGAGAKFIIELPIAPAAAAEAEKVVVPLPAQTKDEGRGKRVLVVDDEEAILDLVSEVLTFNGYQVDSARDGEVALRQLQQQRYDLTLCDWKMPGLNGQQVYERLQANDPDAATRFVFMTGDVINEKTQRFLQENEKICLSKPFKLNEFRSVVSKVLKAA